MIKLKNLRSHHNTEEVKRKKKKKIQIVFFQLDNVIIFNTKFISSLLVIMI